jgi:4,5-dihydroxyphthalate decarboxylase
MIQHSEFDVSEMALASFVILRSRGTHDFVGIPAFLSRSFRHDAIFINKRSGIRAPGELLGKRIGVPEYQMTTAVWMRAVLEDDYGVRPEDCEWFQGSLEQPGRIPHTPVSPSGVQLSLIPSDKTLSSMLERNEIDALISPRKPTAFRGGEGDVVRLFDEPWAAARDYFARTNIFPIMHLVVVRSEIIGQYPWVAQTLFDAFLAAKELAEADLVDATALRTGLPFLVEEAETVIDTMGRDFWSYGVEANRHQLETYMRHSVRQGLIPEPLNIDDLFPASTRTTSRI